MFIKMKRCQMLDARCWRGQRLKPASSIRHLTSENTERQPALATVCLSSQLVSPAKGGQARARTIRLLSPFDKLIFASPRAQIGTIVYAPGSHYGAPFSPGAGAGRPATARGGETGYNACRRESVKTFIRGTPRSDLS